MKIAIIGNKGGTGKTTIAVHIAYAIAEREKVLLIDLDYTQHSALNWVLGRDKKYKFGEVYTKGNLHLICPSKDKASDIIDWGEKEYKYVVIDGRPEAYITGLVLSKMKNEPIILPIAVEADAIKQSEEVRNAIIEIGAKVRQYAIITKMTQARVSQMLVNKIERDGFDILCILPFTEYYKIAEMNNVPIWNVRGAGHTKHPEVLRQIAMWFYWGRL